MSKMVEIVGELVDVPPSAFIPCPAAGFALVSVLNRCCGGCPQFGGFVRVDPNQPTFELQHRVTCNQPMHRRMTRVEA